MTCDFKNVHFSISNSEETKSSVTDVEAFLEQEKSQNVNKAWNKLDKSIKINKLYEYADCYSKEKGISGVQTALLKSFLKNCLDKKRLESGKDIQFNVKDQKIEGIPRLNYANKRFTLRRNDKRITTSSSLGPKKKTIKNKDKNKT